MPEDNEIVYSNADYLITHMYNKILTMPAAADSHNWALLSFCAKCCPSHMRPDKAEQTNPFGLCCNSENSKGKKKNH